MLAPSLQRSESMASNVPDESKKRKEKRAQSCQRCANHGVVSLMRGHKQFCQFANCSCKECKFTKARQTFMKHQQRIWRAQDAGETAGPNSPKRQQRCRLCANHNLLVEKKGHKQHCQFLDCNCKLCSFTKKRQCVMKRQQREWRYKESLIADPGAPGSNGIVCQAGNGYSEEEEDTMVTMYEKRYLEAPLGHSPPQRYEYEVENPPREVPAVGFVRNVNEPQGEFLHQMLPSPPYNPYGASNPAVYNEQVLRPVIEHSPRNHDSYVENNNKFSADFVHRENQETSQVVSRLDADQREDETLAPSNQANRPSQTERAAYKRETPSSPATSDSSDYDEHIMSLPKRCRPPKYQRIRHESKDSAKNSNPSPVSLVEENRVEEESSPSQDRDDHRPQEICRQVLEMRVSVLQEEERKLPGTVGDQPRVPGKENDFRLAYTSQMCTSTVLPGEPPAAFVSNRVTLPNSIYASQAAGIPRPASHELPARDPPLHPGAWYPYFHPFPSRNTVEYSPVRPHLPYVPAYLSSQPHEYPIGHILHRHPTMVPGSTPSTHTIPHVDHQPASLHQYLQSLYIGAVPSY